MGKLIYLSGQMTNGEKLDPTENIKAACRVADALETQGHDVYIPHLTWYMAEVCPHEYDEWIKRDLRWVARSDLVIRIPGESKGADIETEFAKKHGIRVIELEPVFLEFDYQKMCSWVKMMGDFSWLKEFD